MYAFFSLRCSTHLSMKIKALCGNINVLIVEKCMDDFVSEEPMPLIVSKEFGILLWAAGSFSSVNQGLISYVSYQSEIDFSQLSPSPALILSWYPKIWRCNRLHFPQAYTNDDMQAPSTLKQKPL